MDGWIVLETSIEQKQFEKDLAKLKKQAEKESNQIEKLLSKKSKLEIDNSKAKHKLDELYDKAELVGKKMGEMESVNLPKDLASNLNYQKLINQHDQILNRADEYEAKIESNVSEINNLNSKISETNQKHQETTRKIEEIKGKSKGINVDFSNIGNSIMGCVKKVGQMALALFSVRGAYSLISQATSTLSQYNDNIANKLYGIKLMFASALEPLITRIVNLAWKLMYYINYIAKAWFGVDLFASATEKSLKDSSKNAKKLKNTLAGFDEMNVLNDNGSTGLSGASGPSMPDMPQGEVPSWVKWIAENKDTILGFLKKAAILIGLLKLGELLVKILSIGKAMSSVVSWIKKIFSADKLLKATGIMLMVTGVTMLITAFQKLFFHWDEMSTKEKVLTALLAVLGAAFIALGYAIATGFSVATLGIGAIIAAVVAAVTAVVAFIAKLATEEKAIKSVEDAEKSLKEATEALTEANNTYIDSVDNAEEKLKALEEAERRTGLSGEELNRQVEQGILDYKDMTAEQREVYKAYLDNDQAQKALNESSKELTKAKKEEKIASWENKLAVMAEKGQYDEYKKAVVEAFERGELSSKEARDLIGKSMSEMSRDSQKTFMQDLPNDIKNGLDPKNYETTAQKLTKWASELGKNIGKGISSATQWVKEKLGFSSGGITISGKSKKGYAKGGIVYPKLQYLASGGIINQPGRGVPLTQAIGGERGQEGILPLTDSQQMDLLGASIARHMSINLTNINQMNGRTISRELKKIDASNGFATNG